jgi:predicted metalloprotease
MSLINSSLLPKRITMKAGAAVGTAVVLALSAGPAHADESPEAELTDAIGVVNQYWWDNFAANFGGSYTPPDLITDTSVGIDGIYDSSVDQVICGGEEHSEVDNAFYCYPDNFIAVDDHFLQDYSDNGDVFGWVIAAHEWGHAIQAQLQPEYWDQEYELQADCLAGAALEGAEEEGLWELDESDPQEIADSLTAIADETPWSGPGDHGDASERMAYFNYGVDNGPTACLAQP